MTTNANLTGDVTSIGNATTLTNAAVIGKVLTGYTAAAGTVAAADNILEAIQKLDGNNATKQSTLTNSAGLAGALSDETGTGLAVFANSPTLITPNLGTPSTLVGTNITGTAAGLTAGTVTTNANLTGPITSSGNTTSITSQTGTGTTFVMSTSPALVTPAIKGSGTGLTTLASANSSATNYTQTLPAANGTVALTSNLNAYVLSNILVSRISISDLSINTPTGSSLFNYYTLTGQTQNASFADPTGSPLDGNSLIIKITDLGGIGGLSISWGAKYRGGTIPLPTVINKTIVIQFMFNASVGFWDLLAITDGIE